MKKNRIVGYIYIFGFSRIAIGKCCVCMKTGNLSGSCETSKKQKKNIKKERSLETKGKKMKKTQILIIKEGWISFLLIKN